MAIGSLIAPLLTSVLGGTGALTACGVAVVAYGLVLLRAPRGQAAPAPAEADGAQVGEDLLAAADAFRDTMAAVPADRRHPGANRSLWGRLSGPGKVSGPIR